MFWMMLGVVFALVVWAAYAAMGAAFATCWGVTFALFERRWGTARAGALGVGVVWLLAVCLMWRITGDAGWTAGFAALTGVGCIVSIPWE